MIQTKEIEDLKLRYKKAFGESYVSHYAFNDAWTIEHITKCLEASKPQSEIETPRVMEMLAKALRPEAHSVNWAHHDLS